MKKINYFYIFSSLLDLLEHRGIETWIQRFNFMCWFPDVVPDSALLCIFSLDLWEGDWEIEIINMNYFPLETHACLRKPLWADGSLKPSTMQVWAAQTAFHNSFCSALAIFSCPRTRQRPLEGPGWLLTLQLIYSVNTEAEVIDNSFAGFNLIETTTSSLPFFFLYQWYQGEMEYCSLHAESH